jgi:hypothetical protein
MGFAQELSDFFTSYKGMREIGFKEEELKDKDEDRKQRQKYYDQLGEDRDLDRAERVAARAEALTPADMRGGAGDAYRAATEGATAHPTDARYPRAGYEAGALPAFARNDPLAKLVLTTYGEAAGEGPEGWQGVASTVVNRSAASGRGVDAEVTRKGQFEPWMTPEGRARMARITPEKYAAIRQVVAPIAEGKVPEKFAGVTHFYAPKAQRALGRARPAWDDGTGVDTGNHRFFRKKYAEEMGVDPEEQPVLFAASGGLIDDDYSGNDESGGSNPAVRDAVEEGDYDPRGTFKGGTPMPDIVDDGVRGIQSRLEPAGQGVDPQRAQKLEAFARNAGAPSPRDVKMIGDKVDPQGKLTEGQRAIAGWKAVYDFHTQKGNAPAAQRAAMAMLMYTKAAATQGGAIAEAAFEKGDYEGGAKAIVNAYNTLPDGTRIEIAGKTKDGVKFKMYDEESGEMTEEGEAKIDQLVQMATGMRNGTEWFRAVGAIANKRADKVAARNERERSAVEQFESQDEAAVQSEFLKTLSPEAREKFLQTPLKYQRQRRMEWFDKERLAGRKIGGGSSTAGERADRALAVDADPRKMAIPSGLGEGEQGPTTQQAEGYAAVDADVAFQKRANDPGRRFDKETATEVMGAVDAQLETGVPVKLKADIRNSVGDIANDIARVSDVLPDRAASITVRAMKEGFTMGRDGSVLVGNEPPVYMSQRSRLELARIRGALTTPKGTRDDAPTGQVSHGASARPNILQRLATPPEEGLPLSRRGGNVRQTMSNMGRAPAALPVDPNPVADTSKYDRDEKRRRKESRGVSTGGVF